MKGLRKLICPLCLVEMKIIVSNKEHINSVSKVLKKYKYYQYHCEVCDQKFTTTESDTDAKDIVRLKEEVLRLSTLNRKHEQQLIAIGQFCASEIIKHPKNAELLNKIINLKIKP